MRQIWLLALLVAGCTPSEEGRDRDRPDPVPTDPTDVFPEVDPPELLINEVMADNESTVNGPDGYSTPDYVEIVNMDEEDVELSRVELVAADGSWKGPAGEFIAPGERLVIWADVAADDDPMWTGFGLDKENDEILLLGDGYPVDEVELVDLIEEDVSLARIPDLTGDFMATAWPTPGLENGDTASPTLDAAGETVFVDTIVHQIRFTMTPGAYKNLSNADRPEVHTEVSIDGVAFEDVGLKLKGSASYDTMDGKPAFVVDMNEFVLGTRFRTLKGIGLHNGNVLDPTRCRDWITYKLARESGLIAPRVGWAEVFVNDAYYGIYMMIERHDDNMLEHRIPGAGEVGMLFEPNESQGGGWGGGDFGTGSLAWDYEEGPIPPPPEATDAMKAADALIGKVATDDRVAELWNYVNKDQFLTYMAWEAIVSHTDGYKAPNNWRVYIDGTTYLIEWVPSGAEWTWDSDADPWSFGGNAADWCITNTGCRFEYAEKVLEMADRAEQLDLLTEFQTLSGWLDPIIQQDPRYNAWESVGQARASTIDHLQRNPGLARQAVYQQFPELKP